MFSLTQTFCYIPWTKIPHPRSSIDALKRCSYSSGWGWSVQVAAEFFVNATSPKRPFRLPTAEAAALVEAWFAFPTIDLTPDLFRCAVALRERYQLSYWDAAIVAAAKQMGCRTLYTEDLNAGQTCDGVTVVNPFMDGKS